MSVELMGKVWNLALPSQEKFVLLALADCADDFGMNCYPSIATIARKVSAAERTVQRQIKQLIERGVLAVTHDPMRKRSSQYRITIADVPKALNPNVKDCPKRMRDECISVFDQTCSLCHGRGTDMYGPDQRRWHIGRLLPPTLGGAYSPDNVFLICDSCNRARDGGVKLTPQVDTLDKRRGVSKQVGQGCQVRHSGVSQVTPDPSYEPSEEPSAAQDAAVGDRVGLRRRIKAFIFETYKRRFKIACTWDRSEDAALVKLTEANPQWTAAEYETMLRNRFASEGITGERPRGWLPNLGSYVESPLDRFNKPTAPAATGPPKRRDVGAEVRRQLAE